MSDTEILNYLQVEGVLAVHLDCDEFIEVGAGDLRKAIINYHDNQAEAAGMRAASL